MYWYFKRAIGVGSGKYINFWKFKRLSDENITASTTCYYSLSPQLSYFRSKTRVEFNGSWLKQDKITYDNGKVVNIYIVYEISGNLNVSSYSTLENWLFVSLTTDADIDRYKYFGYGIGFDRHGYFSHPRGETGRNAVIFGVDMSSSRKIDSKKKDILIVGFLILDILILNSLQGLEHTLSAEKNYSINFTENNNKLCLSLHYNGANSYLFVNGTEIHKFKAKDSEIVATPLCLGNISKYRTVDNVKKTGLNGYI